MSDVETDGPTVIKVVKAHIMLQELGRLAPPGRARLVTVILTCAVALPWLAVATDYANGAAVMADPFITRRDGG